jgi:polyisoprenoid-binding protein YceI
MTAMTIAMVAAMLQAPQADPPSTVEIVREESILAVITHKGGLAGGLAHDHLIAASEYDVQLAFDPERPLETRFEMTAPSQHLVVDDPEFKARWYPSLEALGILDDPFGHLSEDDRQKVRREMLDDEQLDAENHPTLSARLLLVEEVDEPGDTSGGDADFPYSVHLELTVRGAAVQKSVAARYAGEGDGRAMIEASGEFRFEDFGIKPYSTFLGAIKVKNEFHVYVNLSLRSSSSATDTAGG